MTRITARMHTPCYVLKTSNAKILGVDQLRKMTECATRINTPCRLRAIRSRSSGVSRIRTHGAPAHRRLEKTRMERAGGRCMMRDRGYFPWLIAARSVKTDAEFAPMDTCTSTDVLSLMQVHDHFWGLKQNWGGDSNAAQLQVGLKIRN